MKGLRHRVHVSPHLIDRGYGEFKPGQHHGAIMRGDWDLRTYPITGNPLVRMALAHWEDGVGWEDTGAVAYQLERIRLYGSHAADGLWQREDILRRYDRLDQLFELTARAGEFPPEANAEDGIYIHLDRQGQAVFGQRGVHRFVIATVLGHEQVTAQLGVVHARAPQALRFRLRPRDPLTALPPPAQNADDPFSPTPDRLLAARLLRRRRPS